MANNNKPHKREFIAGGYSKVRFANNIVATQADFIDTATDMVGENTMNDDIELQDAMIDSILVNSNANTNSAQIKRYKSNLKRKAMLKKTATRYYKTQQQEAEQELEREADQAIADKNRLRNLKRRVKAKANKSNKNK